MPPRLSLRTVPPDRRSQMDAIRRRENESLVEASKAEAALDAAEAKLAELVASQQGAVDAARVAVGVAYQRVIEAFGSKSRAAEYLDITVYQLKTAIAAVPAEPTNDPPTPAPVGSTSASAPDPDTGSG